MINFIKHFVLFFDSICDEEISKIIVSYFGILIYFYIGTVGLFLKFISLLFTIPPFLIGFVPLVKDFLINYDELPVKEFFEVLSEDPLTNFFFYLSLTLFFVFLFYFGSGFVVFIGLTIILQQKVGDSLRELALYFILMSMIAALICLLYPFVEKVFCSILFSAVSSVIVFVGVEKMIYDFGFCDYILKNENIFYYDKEMCGVFLTFLIFLGIQITFAFTTGKITIFDELNAKQEKKEKEKKREEIKIEIKEENKETKIDDSKSQIKNIKKEIKLIEKEKELLLKEKKLIIKERNILNKN